MEAVRSISTQQLLQNAILYNWRQRQQPLSVLDTQKTNNNRCHIDLE